MTYLTVFNTVNATLSVIEVIFDAEELNDKYASIMIVIKLITAIAALLNVIISFN